MMKHNHSAILMVDDDPDECEHMADILSDRGYRVDTAPGGSTALRLVEKQPYDVALLDLKMPGMDGLTLCREVTRLSPKTVALLVTGYPDDINRADARSAGICQIICKPVDVRRLLTTIEGSVGGDIVGGADVSGWYGPR